jgi:enoyl-CoA hydratase
MVKTILSKSPTSLKVTLEQLHRGKNLDFNTCMQMEYRLMIRFLQGHDFYEGVRAVIVDKDQKPQWKPSTLNEVTPQAVEHYFSPLEGMPELSF